MTGNLFETSVASDMMIRDINERDSTSVAEDIPISPEPEPGSVSRQSPTLGLSTVSLISECPQ